MAAIVCEGCDSGGKSSRVDGVPPIVEVVLFALVGGALGDGIVARRVTG